MTHPADNNPSCIFCGTTTFPKTREHVIHDSLGGTLVLDKEVCEDCNTRRFSQLDGDFVSYVRDFLNAHHPDVQAGVKFFQRGVGVQFDVAQQAWLSVSIDRHGKPIVLTQIVLKSEGEIILTLDHRHAKKAKSTIRAFIGTLGKLEGLVLKKMLVPNVERLEPAFIFNSDGKVAIRAKDEATFMKVRDGVISGAYGKALKSVLAQIEEKPLETVQGTGPIPIQKRMSIPIGNIYRAAMKVAVELGCVAFGSEWIGHACFGDAKAFVMEEPKNLDERCPVHQIQDAVVLPILEGQHLAVIVRQGHHLFVYLVFYQHPGWMIHLSDSLPEDFSLQDPTIFLFDYRSRCHRQLGWDDHLDEITGLFNAGALLPSPRHLG